MKLCQRNRAIHVVHVPIEKNHGLRSLKNMLIRTALSMNSNAQVTVNTARICFLFSTHCANCRFVHRCFGRRDKLVKGDANGNGIVDISDATAIQRKLADYTVSNFNEKAADIDGNGPDINDVTNNGVIVKAEVKIISNGVLGELTQKENIDI